MITTCKICNKALQRRLLESGAYVNEEGRRWKAKVCPDCLKSKHRKYMRNKRGSDLSRRACEQCKIEFDPKRGNQLYCGIPCRRMARRKK